MHENFHSVCLPLKTTAKTKGCNGLKREYIFLRKNEMLMLELVKIHFILKNKKIYLSSFSLALSIFHAL